MEKKTGGSKKGIIVGVIILIVVVIGVLLFIFKDKIFKSEIEYMDTCWQSEKDNKVYVCFKDDKMYNVISASKIYRYETDGVTIEKGEMNKGTIEGKDFEFKEGDEEVTLSYNDQEYKKSDIKLDEAVKSNTKFVVKLTNQEDKTEIKNEDILNEENATLASLLMPRLATENMGMQSKDKKYYYLKSDEDVKKLKSSTLKKKQICFKYDDGKEQTDFDVEPDYSVENIEVYYCNK